MINKDPGQNRNDNSLGMENGPEYNGTGIWGKRRPKRNKQETIRILRETALNIIRTEGINALGVNKLERESGKSKKMIYEYFGSIDNLLKEIVEANDIWLTLESHIETELEFHRADSGRELASSLLNRHLNELASDDLAKHISLLELTDRKSEILKGLTASRERLGEKIFGLTTQYFAGSSVDIRMIFALLIGGINYLVLFSESNESPFCGMNTRNQEDQDDLLQTLELIADWAYQHGEDLNKAKYKNHPEEKQ